MKHIPLSRALIAAALLASPALAQEAPQDLPSLIGSIADKDAPQASDFYQMATQTAQLGKAAKQTGAQMPPSIYHDALDAVDAGRALNPLATDWDILENELRDLLKEQEGGGEGGEEERDEDGQKGKQQKGEQGQQQQKSPNEDGEQQEQQDGEQSDQQSQDQSGDSQQQQQQSGGEQGEEGQEGAESEGAQQQDGSQMGKLDEGSGGPPQLDHAEDYEGEVQEEHESMQSVGGAESAPTDLDAQTAAILQKLNQLKQQDDPAKLFMLLEEAQKGKKSQKPSNNKDW